ncbi:MAG: DUF1800 domain-containing protein [Pseudomonadota bacterium]|nr:DUF1800 domain-containing protein [Pseudomonadota bacterium]
MKPFALLLMSAALAQAAPVQAVSSATTEQQAAHVLNRLGFGPRPGDIDAVASMGVRHYIDQQLDPAALPLPATLTAKLATLDTVNRPAGAVLADYVAAQKQSRDETDASKAQRRLVAEKINRDTADARVLRALESPRQLEEVMVDFWFNHFNVFIGKGEDRALIASYERDAIRPNAMGNFRDLLGATAKHPAMLYYLDNVLSSAPNANAKTKGKAAGLNENYARELMELHTLGVDAGYSQQDVTELARMLTGWTYDKRKLIASNETFRFDARRHDNGAKTWLGQTVAPAGQQEGEQALDVLAMHPATARHISEQLAQYFVQDAPPPALVARMAQSWQDSHGDIRTVLRTMFYSHEFMAPAALNAKFKTPYRYVLSAARAAATPVVNPQPLLSAMSQLGMPLYGCQTPDGYKNTQEAWLNPDALSRRIMFATGLAAGRLALASVPSTAPAPDNGMTMMTVSMPPAVVKPAPPVPLDAASVDAALGSTISPRTRAIVASTAAPLRASMLLGSPDFMQY